MATINKNAGFLSKMVQLIRQPAKVEVDESELGQNSEFIKLALKERIERKRQDDTVRRREFAYLRKMRNNGPLVGQIKMGRPSIFQHSSGFNPEERALTIKKIDDIEAHMSQNWLDRRQDKPAATQNSPARSLPTLPILTQQVKSNGAAPVQALMDDSNADYDFTKVNLSAPPETRPADEPTQAMSLEPEKREPVEAGVSGFSQSKLMSIELGDSLGDPSLQDAAIRFAEGDDAGAEAALLAALQVSQEQLGTTDACAAALFDFYRATGQRTSFDMVAIDYAERFGRSAPEWFSIPELLAHKGTPLPLEKVSAPIRTNQSVWDCPEELDLPAVQALRALLSTAKVPLHLHWNPLKRIDAEGLGELAALFEQWCAQPITLYFSGVDALQKAMKLATPASDMRVDHLWWRLRMDALCFLRKPEEFEDVAVDYCVLYEVSPPSWKDPLCTCIDESENDEPSGQSVDSRQSYLSDFDQHASESAAVELSGELLGDPDAVLSKIQEGLGGADRLVISCARLIRVDFSAAGSILNWVAQREVEGCYVQFSDVPRLVAAFFNVIGINDHARIVLRTK